MGHYVQNISETEEVEFLEIFRSDKFQDFSLAQWLGETPARMVREHLFKSDRKAGQKFAEELKRHEGEKDEVREHQVFKGERRRSDGDSTIQPKDGDTAAKRVIEEQRREIEELKARLRR